VGGSGGDVVKKCPGNLCTWAARARERSSRLSSLISAFITRPHAPWEPAGCYLFFLAAIYKRRLTRGSEGGASRRSLATLTARSLLSLQARRGESRYPLETRAVQKEREREREERMITTTRPIETIGSRSREAMKARSGESSRGLHLPSAQPRDVFLLLFVFFLFAPFSSYLPRLLFISRSWSGSIIKVFVIPVLDFPHGLSRSRHC